ncbi:DUF4169 family protein [Aurantimonas sp. 22II-16-19i]|uniref:DUF4169 family protein n=1 Tax=Aurantimonas sp. 22II-16-19i TaxID=1317114 RepID=UPI0009F7EA82|nr:DUF4169 family protein [Aurantimonas sp. 22II-16-19i]ORE94812.1 hypothetical protein ATO4_14169 [Aurantimonas sp. 22II-16-19i]
MGDVVNLRRARKQRLRDTHERVAAENRARSGRSKAERNAERIEGERRQAVLDGSRIARPETPAELEPSSQGAASDHGPHSISSDG